MKSNDVKSILVIDDDIPIADIVKQMLEIESFTVFTANTGFHGIRIARNKHCSLVLLDYFLPGENTDEIAKQLIDLPQKPRMILMSANRNAKEVAEKLQFAFLEKPFQRESLLAVIKRSMVN